MKLLQVAVLGVGFALLSTGIYAQTINAPTGDQPANPASTQGLQFNLNPSEAKPSQCDPGTLLGCGGTYSLPLRNPDGTSTGIDIQIPQDKLKTLQDLTKK